MALQETFQSHWLPPWLPWHADFSFRAGWSQWQGAATYFEVRAGQEWLEIWTTRCRPSLFGGTTCAYGAAQIDENHCFFGAVFQVEDHVRLMGSELAGVDWGEGLRKKYVRNMKHCIYTNLADELCFIHPIQSHVESERICCFFLSPERSSESVPGRSIFWLHVYKLWKYNIACFSSPRWAKFNHGQLCHIRQWFWAPMSTYIILHTYTGAKIRTFELPQVFGTPCLDDGLGGKIRNCQHQHPCFLLQFRWVSQLDPGSGHSHSPPSRSILWRTPISAPPPLNCE